MYEVVDVCEELQRKKRERERQEKCLHAGMRRESGEGASWCLLCYLKCQRLGMVKQSRSYACLLDGSRCSRRTL